MFMQRKLQKFFSFLDYIKRTIHFIFYCRFTLILYHCVTMGNNHTTFQLQYQFIIGKKFIKGLKWDCGSGRPLYLCIVIKNKWH